MFHLSRAHRVSNLPRDLAAWGDVARALVAISILMASLLVSGRVAQGKPPTPDVRGWLQVNAPRSMADARL